MQNDVQPMDRRMMREMNQNMLLNLVRAHAPISRVQLKHLSGLSAGTIFGITTELIEQGLLTEIGVAESTGGRKAGLLEIYPDGGYVLGIDLREYHITGAVLNLHGNIVYEETWPARLRNNADGAIDIIARGVETFIAHSGIPREKLLGLGCGVSGPVNAQTGTNIDSWILNWHNVELSGPLNECLHMPVFVDNSVNCFASYQKLYGIGRPYRNFLLVTLGRGLGMAIVINGDLFRGAQGMGAEFGHIPFDVNGRRCECGNQGCLEAYVGDCGIFTTYRELSASPLAHNDWDIDPAIVDDLFMQAQQGDALARRAFELTGAYLGIGIATLVNLFNPESIILFNGNGPRADMLLPAMKETMQRSLFSQLGSHLNVILEENFVGMSWARGAGCLVLRDFFSSPMQPAKSAL